MKKYLNFNPNVEEAESQNSMLARYLNDGNTITSLEAWSLIECGRLASRIDNLHDKGIPVKTVDVVREAYVDEFGFYHKRKTFSAYYLEDGISHKYNVKVEDIPAFVKMITEKRINTRY